MNRYKILFETESLQTTTVLANTAAEAAWQIRALWGPLLKDIEEIWMMTKVPKELWS